MGYGLEVDETNNKQEGKKNELRNVQSIQSRIGLRRMANFFQWGQKFTSELSKRNTN